MKEWWQQLNVREQKLVAAMGFLIGIFFGGGLNLTTYLLYNSIQLYSKYKYCIN